VSVDHEQVKPAVVIHIKECRSPTDQRKAYLSKTRRHSHIFESSRALVPIERVGLIGKFGDEHGEASAVIVVAPGHAHGTECLALAVHGDAADHRVVGERAVVIIVIEVIGRRVVRHKQIRPAVVVVVTPDRAQTVVFIGIAHASFLRDFLERAIATIVVEQVGLALHAPGSALHGHALELAKIG
jgi:hypothetical protein